MPRNDNFTLGRGFPFLDTLSNYGEFFFYSSHILKILVGQFLYKITTFLLNFLMLKFCGKANSPKLCGNCGFPQNFHTRKLGEILVFHAMNLCVKLHGFVFNAFEITT